MRERISQAQWKYCMYVGVELLSGVEPWLTFGRATSHGLMRLRTPARDYEVVEDGEFINANAGIYWTNIRGSDHDSIVQNFLGKYARLVEERFSSDEDFVQTHANVSSKLKELKEVNSTISLLEIKKQAHERVLDDWNHGFSIGHSLSFMRMHLRDYVHK